MGFEFITSPRIVFEWGAVNRLPGICAGLGKRCLVVTGGSSLRRSGVLDALLEGLADNGVDVMLYDRASGEPTLQTVGAAVELGRSAGVDVVLGIGGGSAMDTAKAAAGVIPNAGRVRDYLEGVGTAKITADPLPFIAAPTRRVPAASDQKRGGHVERRQIQGEHTRRQDDGARGGGGPD